MLIAQGPLRISLFGGGSDLPAFLERNEGAVVSLAIDKRVYVVGHPFTHRRGILLKYSKSEDVVDPNHLQHPIARVVLDRYGLNDIDIAVMSDVPAGTGMGSSSSFTVAFLAFVRHLLGIPTERVDLAREACEIEIDVLKEPIGYQDQWASALGGINFIRFSGGEVETEPIGLGSSDIERLESNVHLVPVGSPRSASSLLSIQSAEIRRGSRAEKVTQSLVKLAVRGKRALLEDMDSVGPLLDEAWRLKKELAPHVTNSNVNSVYNRGLGAGASGGKLLGAGASGYLAFYVPSSEHERFRHAFRERLEFRVSSQGAGVVYIS